MSTAGDGSESATGARPDRAPASSHDHGEPPFVDEHSREVAAPVWLAWRATLAVVTSSFDGGGAERVARLIGCEPNRRRGEPGAEDSEVVGFRIVRADPPHELRLSGRHRFSRYRLDFVLVDLGGGRSRLGARTFAEFPGPAGRVYRTLVIGSRIHVLVTRRLLAAIARRAEHAA